jgi:hypothetical protein
MASKIMVAIALLLSFALSTSAIPTISALGNKFFDSDGKQFFVKGASISTLPLMVADICQELHTNWFQTTHYSIPNNANAMQA